MPTRSTARLLSRRRQRDLIVLVAAGAGAALARQPTGLAGLDQLWCAAFVAFLAWASATAARASLLVGAGACGLVAVTGTSLGFAAAAVALGLLNALQVNGNRRVATAVGGLIALSLLTGSGTGPTWARTLTTTTIYAGVAIAGLLGMRARVRRKTMRAALVAVGALVVFAAVGGIGALLGRADIDRGTDAFAQGAALARNGDIDGAAAAFGVAEDALRAGERTLGSVALPLLAIPGLAQQADASSVAVAAAADAAAVARRTARAIDLDQVAVSGGALDLDALRALGEPLDDLSAALDDSVRRIAAVDRRLLLAPVSDALDRSIVEASDAFATAERIRRFVEVAPDLLGDGGVRRYLILFTSPVETRNRFGFPGAYAVLRFDQGQLDVEQSGALQDINVPGGYDQLRLDVAPRAQPYLPYSTSVDLRSVTTPADFPAAADLAAQLVAQTPVGAVDGVVLVTPEAMAALVGIVGPVELAEIGETVTAEATVDFVTRRQYLEFPELGEQQQDRKDLLADLADVVGERLEVLDLSALGTMVDSFGALDVGDLLLWVPPETSVAAGALLAENGLDGALPRTQADLLHVGNINGGGNKIDLYLRRSLDYEATVEEDGTIRSRLEVTMGNDAPATGQPFYLIGSSLEPPLPLGTNRSIMLLYSRHPLVTAELDGQPVDAVTFADGDLFVHQVVVDLGPGQQRSVVATFEGRLDPDVPYDLVLLPNGLIAPDTVTAHLIDRRTGADLETTITVAEATRVALDDGLVTPP